MPIQRFRISTDRRHQIIDITSQVQEIVRAVGCDQGLACISVPHCTCAVYVNENESGLVADMLALLSQLPAGDSWRHNRIDNNAEAHLMASLVGNSTCLPVSGGQVELGTWQRIMLIELDGPRERRITLTVVPG